MANEVHITYTSSSTLYFRVRNSAGQVWNTSTPAFENWNAEDVTDYDVALVDKSGNHYVGSFPACDAGTYFVDVFIQAGGSPAVGDVCIGSSSIRWDGSAELDDTDITNHLTDIKGTGFSKDTIH